MISKNWTKLIKSLQVKKYRKIHQSFLVEGAKSVEELLQSDFQLTMLFSTESFYQEHIRLLKKQSLPLQLVSAEELEKVGSFQTNNACLAIAQIKPNVPIEIKAGEYGLALDEVKDPGNLGTILRIADWYGITKVICSENTADVYNPKVIAASMGSFTRVQTYYCNLTTYLTHFPFKTYGAFLEGVSVHAFSFESSGLIVMGNESQGISPEVAPAIQEKIHIPRFGGAESLNVGIATAIICDNLRRQVGVGR